LSETVEAPPLRKPAATPATTKFSQQPSPAIAARVDLIVSGDRDLLSIGT